MKLVFKENAIYDQDPACITCGPDGILIMHSDHIDYEHAVADFITKENHNILEIGYGMGLSAKRIQTHNPALHVIIEKEKEIYDKAVEWVGDKENITVIHGDYKDKIATLTDKFDGIYHSADKEQKGNLFNFANDIKSLAKDNCILVMLNWDHNTDIINKANYKKIETSQAFKDTFKEPETIMIYTTLVDSEWNSDDINSKYIRIM